MAAKGGRVGTIKSTSINGVNLYSVTGKNYVDPWVLDRKKRSLRKDTEYQRRLELIHDPRFEAATTRFKVTPDDQYVIASDDMLRSMCQEYRAWDLGILTWVRTHDLKYINI